VRKTISVLLAAVLALGLAVPAMAAVKPNKYSLPLEGTVLQNIADRNIKPLTPPERHPIIAGESPTTGLSWAGVYLPMLVQISVAEGSVKVNNKTVKAAGIGSRAPWGGAYADVVYEGILYRDGATRMSFLFSDSLDEGLPLSVGPVRSARIGHVLLREEWQSGIVYHGGPRKEENNIAAMFEDLGASDLGVLFNTQVPSWAAFAQRVKGLKGPDNLSADVVGLRNQIPTNYTAAPHAFLFADASPYTEGYDMAYNINLDWGHVKWVSHFVYDEAENLYFRYSGDAPFLSYASADDLTEENATWMSFANVIIQRVTYEYTNNSKIMPVMQSVGKGNADIFIGGRYIAGYWIRESIESPTVFYDNLGNELQFTRGKTYIAHLPPESLCTFTGME
jgi:hypothetical protein